MIALIDYGAGNLESVGNALRKLKQPFKTVSKPQQLSGAQKVILPGVGAAKSAMWALRENGFDKAIPQLTVPFLGICLGLQLLADFSEEGDARCLGIIPGCVKKFPDNELKVPQVGWNSVSYMKQSPLFKKISDNSYFYFVNSFYFDAPQENILGRTLYTLSFPSVVQKENFYAVQFHPEKSGKQGLQLLRNFCELC